MLVRRLPVLFVFALAGALQAQSLSVELGSRKSVHLAGRDAGTQLIVTDAKQRDVTHQAKYQTDNANVHVSETGYVSALAEGQATVAITGPDGSKTAVAVQITDIVRDVPINFTNEVVPVFTRFGCNAGGCHGKSGGQNHFSLSLLGFEPQEDYEFIIKETRGRRIFPAAPEQSVLVQKATGLIPHGGGNKIAVDSPAYRLMVRWIEQGTPFGTPADPVVQKLEVLPSDRLLQRNAKQQIAVLAHFSDGSIRDVTSWAQYESNDGETAGVSESGLVSTRDRPGSAAIMVRYQDQVAAFRCTIPLGHEVTKLPPVRNFIDTLTQKQWTKLGLPPAELCDDATFLRRVTLDLAGRLPTLEEAQAFTGDDKRTRLIDRLLASDDFADFFTAKWSAVLRNRKSSPKDDAKATIAFHGWIRDAIQKNMPFDQFVRELLTATGEEVANPPVAWYREVKDIHAQTEDVAQLFLGTRLQCARCHHHPLEKWSQQDYYGLSAFFSRVGYKTPPKVEQKKGQPKQPIVKQPTHVLVTDVEASAINPRTNLAVQPTVLGGVGLDIPTGTDPRAELVKWMTSPDNPYFAKTLANRVWKHFMGRGLVEPEDDMRATNPPTNPELLDALAKRFKDSKYDVRALIRDVVLSSTYQLSSDSSEENENDRQNYSYFRPRRLHAEVLFDAIDQLTLTKPAFPGVPAGTRAVQLPDHSIESYFLTLFGRPDASSACECERSFEVSLPQMLHLFNSYEMQAKVTGTMPKPPMQPSKTEPKSKTKAPVIQPTRVIPGDRINKILADKRGAPEKIRDLYLIAYGREPIEKELALLTKYVTREPAELRAAYEDVLWAIINSEEFLFNH